MPTLELSREELWLTICACERELDRCHTGELRKRNVLMVAYRKMLGAHVPERKEELANEE